MVCTNCGKEYEGRFCPNCGTPAPQSVTCLRCRNVFIGRFCPKCGEEAIDPSAPIEVRCRHLYDRNGNFIDVDRLAGAYISTFELRGYFRRCTTLSPHDINEFASYIDKNIEGCDFGELKALTERKRFEAAGKKLPELKVEQVKIKERISENKENAVACCPKCGSTSIDSTTKTYHVGLLIGNIHAKKKLWVTCLNCGHRWKI